MAGDKPADYIHITHMTRNRRPPKPLPDLFSLALDTSQHTLTAAPHAREGLLHKWMETRFRYYEANNTLAASMTRLHRV